MRLLSILFTAFLIGVINCQPYTTFTLDGAACPAPNTLQIAVCQPACANFITVASSGSTNAPNSFSFSVYSDAGCTKPLFNQTITCDPKNNGYTPNIEFGQKPANLTCSAKSDTTSGQTTRASSGQTTEQTTTSTTSQSTSDQTTTSASGSGQSTTEQTTTSTTSQSTTDQTTTTTTPTTDQTTTATPTTDSTSTTTTTPTTKGTTTTGTTTATPTTTGATTKSATTTTSTTTSSSTTGKDSEDDNSSASVLKISSFVALTLTALIL